MLHVGAPEPHQRRSIIQRIYSIAVSAYGDALANSLADDVIDTLAEVTPRRVKMVLNLVMGFTIADHRKAIAIEDILAAQRLSADSVKTRIGFL